MEMEGGKLGAGTGWEGRSGPSALEKRPSRLEVWEPREIRIPPECEALMRDQAPLNPLGGSIGAIRSVRSPWPAERSRMRRHPP